MVDMMLGYWVGGKSWAVQRPWTRAPEKEKGIAQDSIECYNNRGAVLGLMNGRHVGSQKYHITGMGPNHRIRSGVKQRHPLGNYSC